MLVNELFELLQFSYDSCSSSIRLKFDIEIHYRPHMFQSCEWVISIYVSSFLSLKWTVFSFGSKPPSLMQASLNSIIHILMQDIIVQAFLKSIHSHL